MALVDSRTRTASSKPPLEPTEPISTQVALMQVVLLLGIPLGLLALTKVVLSRFFPGLGY